MPITALRPTLLGALTPALALLLGLSPQGAAALGMGRPQVLSALGKPLDVSVPLTLADGEQLTDSCVRAEVSAGEARVPAGLLQMRVEGDPGERRIRLQSLVRIEEPALRITLALGCPLRLTREFNAFVDPPASTAVAPPPPPATLPSVPTPVPEEAPRALAQASPPPSPPPRPRTVPRPRAQGPRLVLERPEVLVAEAPRPPKPASAPEEVSPELEAQITLLEQTVARLRADLEARQQGGAASPVSPASAPPVAEPIPVKAVALAPRASPLRDPMTWLMTLGLSLLAGAAAFYGSRWRDERARRELAYWRALHAAEGAATPPHPPASASPSPGFAPAVAGGAAALPDEGQHQVTRPQPRPMGWPPAPVASTLPVGAFAPSSMQATQPLPVQAAAAPVLPQELGIADELLDLEQQVDFLQLLGQHEAAADLLSKRLAHGSAGAMPYLMLMELCQQRGEPETFAQLARQFEARFGMLALAWSQSLSRGRPLDANTSVIAHLQVIWTDPAAAVQMLRDLLARGGGPGVPHFELPAYRDLLTLYAVARDLFEAGLRGEEVDLMLPIDSSFGEQA